MTNSHILKFIEEIQTYLHNEPNKLLPSEIDKLNKLCTHYKINFKFLTPEIIVNKSTEYDYIVSKKIKNIYYLNCNEFIRAKL